MTSISATVSTTGSHEYNTSGLSYSTIYVMPSDTATYNIEVSNGGNAWIAHPDGANPATGEDSRVTKHCFERYRVRVTALTGTLSIYITGTRL